jgi:hypothetical protein
MRLIIDEFVHSILDDSRYFACFHSDELLARTPSPRVSLLIDTWEAEYDRNMSTVNAKKGM